MVKAVQGDKKLELIKEMDKKTNKSIIYNCIIKNDTTEIDKATSRELYLYQWIILSLNRDALNSYIDLSINTEVHKELEVDEAIRCSILFDFESSGSMIRTNSQDTVLTCDDNRISIASAISVNTNKSVYSIYSIDDIVEENKISYLALECICEYFFFNVYIMSLLCSSIL